MNKQNCLELQARDIFLREVRITTCEIRAIMLQPLALLFITLVAAAFVAFDAAHLWARMAIWQVAIVWIVAVPLQVILYTGLAAGWAWLQSRLKLPVIYLPILGLLAYAINYPLAVLHVAAQSGRSFSEVMAPNVMISGIIFSLIFEALYFAFVFPMLRNVAGLASPPQAREILVGSERFAIDQLITLRGQEHYVLITTPQGSHRLRARLSDLVSQTNPEDGILAHRSHWISRGAIAGLITNNDNDLIVMNCGEHLPVARPRRTEVRGWIKQHVPHCNSGQDKEIGGA